GLGGTSRDLALFSRAVSGERTAFEALVERYGGRVFRICRAMTKDRDAAEDCFQQTFLLAWQNLYQFRAEAQFSTWLSRIAVNAVLSQWRRREPTIASISIETEHEAVIQLPDRREDPETRCFRGQLRKVLEDAIETLPTRLRIVFLLLDVEERSTEE